MQSPHLPFSYLNLGCGSRYIKEWTNVDFVSSDPHVLAHNLLNGIPFSDACFDVVYHSHVLEHFSPDDGERFTQECQRVLTPNGILRIAVPDLEQIAKNYLDKLVRAEQNGTPQAVEEYRWAVIEMLDQLVREESGGQMLKYWSRDVLSNEEQIVSRVGHEFISIRAYLAARRHAGASNLPPTGFLQKLKNRVRLFLYKKLHLTEHNIEVGNFRNGGEVHKWMYDRFSLRQLLLKTGFREVYFPDAFHSHIPGWEKYRWLDVEENVVRKPDSLFVEAIK